MRRVLEAAAYWQLRARCTDTVHSETLVQQAIAARTTAQQHQAAALRALGLDATLPTFTLDDATLTITTPDDGPGGAPPSDDLPQP